MDFIADDNDCLDSPSVDWNVTPVDIHSLASVPLKEAIIRLRTKIRIAFQRRYTLPLNLAHLFVSVLETSEPAPEEDELLEQTLDHLLPDWRDRLTDADRPFLTATSNAAELDGAAESPAQSATRESAPEGRSATAHFAQPATAGEEADVANRNRSACEIASSRKSEFATSPTLHSSVKSLAGKGFADGGAANCPVVVAAPSCSASSRKRINGRDRGFDRRLPRGSTAKLPAYAKATEAERFKGAMRTAAANGGWAVSLNLSERVEATLRKHADPVRLLSGYINRQMKTLFGWQLPYALVLEVSPEGRLHAHGAIIPIDKSPAHKKELSEMLRSAAGWIHGKQGSRQCVFKEMEGKEPDGWTGYGRLDRTKTVKALDTKKLEYLSHSMRSKTRQAWTDMRWGSSSQRSR